MSDPQVGVRIEDENRTLGGSTPFLWLTVMGPQYVSTMHKIKTISATTIVALRRGKGFANRWEWDCNISYRIGLLGNWWAVRPLSFRMLYIQVMDIFKNIGGEFTSRLGE